LNSGPRENFDFQRDANAGHKGVVGRAKPGQDEAGTLLPKKTSAKAHVMPALGAGIHAFPARE
jgi:hypothetical protein